MASSTRGVTEYRGRSDERSIGDLVGEATNELSLLVRKEVELAKLEMKEQVARVTDSAKFLGIAAFGGYLAVVLLAFAVAWALAEVMPTGVAFPDRGRHLRRGRGRRVPGWSKEVAWSPSRS